MHSDRYVIEGRIAEGGMAILEKAKDLHLGIHVALKFLMLSVLRDVQFLQRFLREARVSARIKSEHVVRVLDIDLRFDTPYIVLEYLDGADLSHPDRRKLSLGAVVDLLLQACEALAEAHAMGVIHRDLKPANLYVTRQADRTRMVKLLDFGIALARTEQARLTGANHVMGTLAYMSPEQRQSTQTANACSDIWSLGVTLYELVENELPFGPHGFSQVARPIAARLPSGLDDVIHMCLQRDPGLRFANVAAFAQAIAPYAQSRTQADLSVQRTDQVEALIRIACWHLQLVGELVGPMTAVAWWVSPRRGAASSAGACRGR